MGCQQWFGGEEDLDSIRALIRFSRPTSENTSSETVWKIAEECLDRQLWVLETSWRGIFIPFGYSSIPK